METFARSFLNANAARSECVRRFSCKLSLVRVVNNIKESSLVPDPRSGISTTSSAELILILRR